MKIIEQLASEIRDNLQLVLAQNTEQGSELWTAILKRHPAEIALLFSFLKEDYFIPLFIKFDRKLGAKVFEKLDVEEQAALLENLDEEYVVEIINALSPEKVIAIFETIPEGELEKYLKMAHKKKRKSLLSSLGCRPDSAGRLVNSKVFSLQSELTIQKSIGIIQALENIEEVGSRVFVVDGFHHLVGYVKLSDLVINKQTKKLSEILRPIEVFANAHDDQETVVQMFQRYEVLSMPVKDSHGHFLGAISASEILDVVQEEMTEDSFKMSGLQPGKRSYMDTPFFTVVLQRVQWLLPLLLLQSFSAWVMHLYGSTINSNPILAFFITMLVGTGGNVGNQSSTLMVRGLITGEINIKNKLDVLIRELKVACFTGVILVSACLVRVFLTPGSTLPSLAAIALSLLSIIISSAFLGTFIPMLLDHFGVDPANSAAPFISTLMDIIGVSIYCVIASLILG
jgi:magnesium transporter